MSRQEQNPLAFRVQLSIEQADDATDWIADVACWFLGFKAAMPDAELPPGLDRLRDFGGLLKQKIAEIKDTP